MVETSTPLGERIAFHRRRRGLSQVKLAGLVGRSESWLSQIERGVRSIDRISVLNQVASALNVPVTELAPGALTAKDLDQPTAVVALRSALTGYDSLGSLLQMSAQEGEGVDWAGLRARVDEAWELVHSSSFSQLGRVTPELIADAEAASRSASGAHRQQAFSLLAETYQIASAVLSKLSETDMAWIAGDRAVLASVRAEEPLMAAASAFRIAHAFPGRWPASRSAQGCRHRGRRAPGLGGRGISRSDLAVRRAEPCGGRRGDKAQRRLRRP